MRSFNAPHLSVTVPCHSLPFLFISNRSKSTAARCFSKASQIKAGAAHLFALPFPSKSEQFRCLAILFIAFSVQNIASPSPRCAAALLLPASLCLCLSWTSKADASHDMVVHFLCLASPNFSRAVPSPAGLLSAVTFRFKANLCQRSTTPCFSSTVHIIARAVRCFSLPMPDCSMQFLCHATSRRAIA